jgi:hypothetical protein
MLAQFNVGRAYYLGIGLAKNETLSRYWFERAALNGDPKSIDILTQLGWAEAGQYSVGTPKEQQAVAKKETTPPVDDSKQPNQKQPSLVASAPPETNVVTSPPATTGSEASTKQEKPKQEKPKEESAPRSEPSIAQNTPQPRSRVLIEERPVTVRTEAGWTVTPLNKPNRSDQDVVPDNPYAAAFDKSIAIYTDPSIRRILVAIEDLSDALIVVSKNNDWTKVTSRKGFPVWVHENYIEVSSKTGIISAESVNARSVPIITKGSIVGQLNKNETLTVLNKKGNWYRVQSPARFQAWVKTSELQNLPGSTQSNKAQPESASYGQNSEKQWLVTSEESE